MYFVDSNVLIGYYFHLADTWGVEAACLFRSGKAIYAGNHSNRECFGDDGKQGRCKTKLDHIKSEFRRAIALMKKGTDIDGLISHADENNWDLVNCLNLLKMNYFNEADPKIALELLKERYVETCLKNEEEIKEIVTIHTRINL